MEENISNSIKEIISKMPDNLEELEKVRWVYVKLGSIISYDYRRLDFKNIVNISDEYISKYQTCVQVSDLLNQLLNSVGVKCESFEREEDKLHYDQAHKYNVVTLNTGEKLYLDLVYDLPYIQNDFKTLNFGYKDAGNEFIVISQFEDKMMDEKMGLYPNGYKDEEVEDFRRELERNNYYFNSYEEEMDYIINKSKTYLNPSVDFVEGSNILEKKMFQDIVRGLIITHNLVNQNMDKIRVYLFNKMDEKVWYLYSKGNNLIKSNEEDIKSLLNNGWINKSGEIYNYISENKIML